MLQPEFLAMLRCPENRTPLAMADAALVGQLNEAATAGILHNRGGKKLEKKLDGALLRADEQVAYPILDEIPILLIEEGILISDVVAKT